MKTENEVISFEFSEEQHQIRSLMINNEPCFVANDICDILGLTNTRDILSKCLDADEKLTYTIYTSGQNRKVNLVTESGLYALIIRSNKPQAKKFRKWITSEVIPSLRKNGTYRLNQSKKSDYIDLRHLPHSFVDLNGKKVKVIIYDDEKFFHLTDLMRSWNSTTTSYQQAKTIQNWVKKFWIYGGTKPAWFVNDAGVYQLSLGNRTVKSQRTLF
jgi:prophage antirepressor-like protein